MQIDARAPRTSSLVLHPGANGRANRLATLASIILADVAAFSCAFVTAVLLSYVYGRRFTPADYGVFVALLLAFTLIYGAAGLYPGVGIHPVRELRGVVIANSIFCLLIMAGTFLTKTLAGAWLLSIVLVILFRNAVRAVLARRHWWGVPVVIFGAGQAGNQLAELLREQPSLGLKVVAILDDDQTTHHRAGVMGGLALAALVADRFGLCHAIVAMPDASPEELATIFRRYSHRFPHFLVIPNTADLGTLWMNSRDFGGISGLEISQYLLRPVPRAVKRVVDIALATLAGLVLAPLFAALAVLVRLTSKGPAIYSQLRVGQNHRVFRAYKFRSMVHGSEQVLQAHFNAYPEARLEWRVSRKLRNDPRLTSFGRLLRRTSLDELPQLWNVLKGDMGLVGPRPITEDEISRYGESIELYSKVLPGITGLWQVSGRNDTSYEERVRLDEDYVRNWSVWLDLWIVGRTVKALITGRGAY